MPRQILIVLLVALQFCNSCRADFGYVARWPQEPDGSITRLDFDGNRVYVRGFPETIAVDISNTAHMRVIGTLGSAGYSWGNLTPILEGKVILNDILVWSSVVNVEDVLQPFILSDASDYSSPAVSWPYVYWCSTNIMITDFSDPAHPVDVGSIPAYS